MLFTLCYHFLTPNKHMENPNRLYFAIEDNCKKYIKKNTKIFSIQDVKIYLTRKQIK